MAVKGEVLGKLLDFCMISYQIKAGIIATKVAFCCIYSRSK